MGLQGPPEELLAHIFTFFRVSPHSVAYDPENRVKMNSLVSAARCSTGMRSAVLLTLYHTFHVGDHAMARFWQFSATIIRRSWLAAMVRVLIVPSALDHSNTAFVRAVFDASCALEGVVHDSPDVEDSLPDKQAVDSRLL